jgi:hypothetical protein
VARSFWADDATWHITGNHEHAGHYNVDAYLALTAQWMQDFPSYEAELRDVKAFGDELALFFLESRGGAAPGAAPGVAIFRVVDGKIEEGWAIPAFAGGRHPF